MNNESAEPSAPAEALTVPSNPMALLMGADLSTIDPDKLEKLLALQERWEDRDAEKQFNAALAQFQADMPPVFKWRQESKGKYNYAAYDDIMRLARPHLRKSGLSISCSQEETETTLIIKMTISHKAGHSRLVTYSTPKDGPIRTADGRAVTSQAQAQGSANSYAKRYCLCNALDIVVTDEDNDAPPPPETPLSEEQANAIHDLFSQFPDPTGEKARFLKWAQSATVETLPASAYEEYTRKITAKLAKL